MKPRPVLPPSPPSPPKKIEPDPSFFDVPSYGLESDEEINRYLGEIIKNWRKQKRLSVQSLSERTQGRLSTRQIQRIEAGAASATYKSLYLLRVALELTTTEMWFPYFLHEEQVPLCSGFPLPKDGMISINFTPGRTVARYALQNDRDQYALELKGSHGLLGPGSMLLVSPAAKVNPGDLVLAIREEGVAKLFRFGIDNPPADYLEKASVHKVVQIHFS